MAEVLKNKGCLPIAAVAAVGLVAVASVWCALNYERVPFIGRVPSPTPTATETATETSIPYLTATLWAPTPNPDAKNACLTMKSLQGHFNQHQEFQIPTGSPRTDNTVAQKLVGWFHNYWEKFHGEANDPLIQTLKNLGVKLYSDIVPSTDIDSLHLRVKTEKTGENLVFFATEAQDINATLANIKNEYTKFYSQYGLTFTENQSKEFDVSLKQGLGITKIEGNNVTVNMGYVENGQLKSHEFTFVAGKTSPDVYPFGPLKGSDRLAVVTQIKFENGKPVINAKTGAELGKVQLIVVDDFATEITWNGKTIKCSGSTNPVATATPVPEKTPNTPTPTITQTPGGPKTPTDTPQPPEQPTATRRATATPQKPESTLPPTSTRQVNPSVTPAPTEIVRTSTPIPRPPTSTPVPNDPTATPGRQATPTPDNWRPPTATVAPSDADSISETNMYVRSLLNGFTGVTH